MKKEKYLQVFNYLLEFSKIRSKPVKDIENSETRYPEILWFADIPQFNGFDCITFPNYNQEADYWLLINKPKNEPISPKFPSLSQTLNDWINIETLIDENVIPTLKDRIIEDNKELLLSARPEISREFKDYLSNKWLSDLNYYRNELNIFRLKVDDYEKQINIYKQLFTISNKSQQFGEEFELVVGIGLLNFHEDSNTPKICRHILTTKVEIVFDTSHGESFIKVFPSIDSEMQIETDAIIDLPDQFDSHTIIEAEKKVAEFLRINNIADNPFDKQIDEAIQIFADRIRTDGQSSNLIKKPIELAKKPTIYFAPALILRKRNTKSFTALYEKIIENIDLADDSINIDSINDLIGHLEKPCKDSDNTQDIEDTNLSPSDDTIYFPKKYNEEQIEIIEKARRFNKVLVQGPPGTGKSHTIANLICHLLANGKKVLVTAYTKRALEVLKNQLPLDFQHLAVNLLSGDTSSIQDLEASVNSINDELARTTNLDIFRNTIKEKGDELVEIRKEIAETKNEWIKIKEKSTRQQEINPNYKGTLIALAERLENETVDFVWFKDDLTDYYKIGLVDDIGHFITVTKKMKDIDCSQFNKLIPDIEKLPSHSQLEDYLRIKRELSEKYSPTRIISNITCQDFFIVSELLHSLSNLYKAIQKNNSPFKQKLLNDPRSNISLVKDVMYKTKSCLSELTDDKLRHFDKDIEIVYPSDKSLIQLKNDAKKLLSYLKEGNSFSGILFGFKKILMPQEVKEKIYFIEKVKVNGSPCDSEEEFQIVLMDIFIKQEFEEISTILGNDLKKNLKNYYDQGKHFRHISNETEELLSLVEQAMDIRTKIETNSSLSIQDFDCKNVLEKIEEVDFNFLRFKENEFRTIINESIRYLSSKNNHIISERISYALTEYDSEKYQTSITEIDSLVLQKNEYTAYKELQNELNLHFPLLVKEILEEKFDFNNFKNIEGAIFYKHAKHEISRLLEDDYESYLATHLSDLETKEERLIALIASKKAWLCIMDNLHSNFSLRQHLQAWVQAVKKIGKHGTGKRALKFRKEAQIQMEKCKDSVPCWIMPLYKVAETVNPEQGMYDYVIIDEASQLGADAIFLMYISKRIIIVGDDKQTSPEYVGVESETMTPYIRKHLHDIPFANYYGIEFSFFDHAKIFCNGMTVLREHFRCMPEIIEFCNKYFYAPDGKGLYPLKQYSENRLEPLKLVYCKNGYVDGNYQNIINRAEAEAITEIIYELISDQRYRGKTFGVIALQGNKQAALIENMILKKIGEVEFRKRKIVCGNSASFQGDERDIMFLSLITAHNHQRAALTKPEDERRFNVAVSRAKEQAWLFHSVQLDDLSNNNDLRYKLLDHFINFKPQQVPQQNTLERSHGTQPEPFESWFEVDVYNDIVRNNFSVIPQYEVAKGRYRIDLVAILANGTKVAIECDGDKYHGAEQFQNDLMRQKVLERCGWQFFRVRGAEYYTNRKKALEPLWKLLSANGIEKNETYKKIQPDQTLVKEVSSKGIESENTNKDTFNTQHAKNNEQRDLFDNENLLNTDNFPKEKSETYLKIKPTLFECDMILVFTSNQNVYKVTNHHFNNLSQVIPDIEFEGTEKPIYITSTNNYSGFLIVGFQNGKVGKIALTSYKTEHNRKKLKNAYNNESKLIYIEHIESEIDLVALSSINKVVLFNTKMINPVDSRTTKGVQVLKQKAGSFMLKMKDLNQTKLQDPDYYRKDEMLNVVGYYLKTGDEV
jgi:very-short-patch-repair endonuclease/DNA polymerase III delta prime subunit